MNLFHIFTNSRNSHPEVFYKMGVFKYFAKFTGKHLRQSLFFDKVAALRPATLFKKRLWHRPFPTNFPKFLKTPFSHNTSRAYLWSRMTLLLRESIVVITGNCTGNNLCNKSEISWPNNSQIKRKSYYLLLLNNYWKSTKQLFWKLPLKSPV